MCTLRHGAVFHQNIKIRIVGTDSILNFSLLLYRILPSFTWGFKNQPFRLSPQLSTFDFICTCKRENRQKKPFQIQCQCQVSNRHKSLTKNYLYTSLFLKRTALRHTHSRCMIYFGLLLISYDEVPTYKMILFFYFLQLSYRINGGCLRIKCVCVDNDPQYDKWVFIIFAFEFWKIPFDYCKGKENVGTENE